MLRLRHATTSASREPGELLAMHQFAAWRVSNVSTTDLTAPKFDFRFTPESGLKSDIGPCQVRAKNRHAVVREQGDALSRGLGSKTYFGFTTG